jgi:hypothetical protein
MFIAPKNTDLLLVEAVSESLYLKLVAQINKDFNLANEGIDFPMSVTPEDSKYNYTKNISTHSV